MIKDAKSFCRQPRRDEGAYPHGSVTEKQRRMTAKERADFGYVILEWILSSDFLNQCLRTRNENGTFSIEKVKWKKGAARLCGVLRFITALDEGF